MADGFKKISPGINLPATTAVGTRQGDIRVSSVSAVPLFHNGTREVSLGYPNRVFNVVDYGATGDGTTDDTTAIQAAFDAAGIEGYVYIPPGTYIVSNLTVPAGLCIRGAGRHQTVLKGKTGSTGYMLTDSGNAVKISIIDMAFYANNCNYSAVIRLGFNSFQWGTEGVIQNIWIRDCPNIGLELDANVGLVYGVSIWSVGTGIRVIGNANYFYGIFIAGFTTRGIDAGDSFWYGLEVEAPATGATPVYFLRQVRIWGVTVSIADATTITNLFQADAGASNCEVNGLNIYTTGSGTYTNLKSGSGITFAVTADNELGTANQLLSMNSSTTSVEYRSIVTSTGGTDVGIVFGTGSITLQVPNASTGARGVITTGTQSIAGAKTFTTQLIGAGTATNDSAAAGYIGEVLSATVSAYTSTGASGFYFDATSVSLTAGDWEVCGYISYNLNGASGMTFLIAGIGSVSGNSAPNLSYEYASPAVPTSATDSTIGVAPVRVSLASTTTIYFKGACNFSAGTPRYKAGIRARRVR